MQHNKPWVINTLNIRPYENFKTRLEEFLIKKRLVRTLIELTSNLVTCYETLDSMLNHTATGFAILRKAEGPEVVSTFSETLSHAVALRFKLPW